MINALIFACAGVAMEIVFTSAAEFRTKRDWSLKGKSYAWMLPIYALVYPALLFLHPRIGDWPFWGRGPVYVLLIYAVEYLCGHLLHRLTGACPWDYGKARWAVQGVIRLDFAPAWLIAALLFERLFLYLPK